MRSTQSSATFSVLTVIFACTTPELVRPDLAAAWAEDQIESKLDGKIENSLGMQFSLAPAGEFQIGSPPDEAGRRDDEPRRHVRLTRAYYIGRHEVTRGQFRRFVDDVGYRCESERDGLGGYGFNAESGELEGRDPKYDWRNTGFEQTDDHPVVNVTWNDAVAFCHWLSRIEGGSYRLPTEAEWECACRARSTTCFANGDDPERLPEMANIVDALAKVKFQDRAAIAGSDGYVFTAPVGSFQANSLGLYDMHGNVWEWCADWYGEADSEPKTDPLGPESGTDRVIHGGDWYHDATFARSASRYPIPPNLPRRHGGFRVVLEP